MNKPTQKTFTYWDYAECAEYVANKLGIENLEDCLGKFDPSNGPWEEREKLELRDFWDYLVETEYVHNRQQFYLSCDEDTRDWVRPILDAFIEEFGEGPYMANW